MLLILVTLRPRFLEDRTKRNKAPGLVIFSHYGTTVGRMCPMNIPAISSLQMLLFFSSFEIYITISMFPRYTLVKSIYAETPCDLHSIPTIHKSRHSYTSILGSSRSVSGLRSNSHWTSPTYWNELGLLKWMTSLHCFPARYLIIAGGCNYLIFSPWTSRSNIPGHV